jgi:Leucine-rich repeat (LRR) protein
LTLFCQCKKEPVVNIEDNNFLKALTEQGVDTDGDGFISQSEAEVITSQDVSDDSISGMTGIEAFVNLDTLKCSNNQITSLDFSEKYLSDRFVLCRELPYQP